MGLLDKTFGKNPKIAGLESAIKGRMEAIEAADSATAEAQGIYETSVRKGRMDGMQMLSAQLDLPVIDYSTVTRENFSNIATLQAELLSAHQQKKPKLAAKKQAELSAEMNRVGARFLSPDEVDAIRPVLDERMRQHRQTEAVNLEVWKRQEKALSDLRAQQATDIGRLQTASTDNPTMKAAEAQLDGFRQHDKEVAAIADRQKRRIEHYNEGEAADFQKNKNTGLAKFLMEKIYNPLGLFRDTATINAQEDLRRQMQAFDEIASTRGGAVAAQDEARIRGINEAPLEAAANKVTAAEAALVTAEKELKSAQSELTKAQAEFEKKHGANKNNAEFLDQVKQYEVLQNIAKNGDSDLAKVEAMKLLKDTDQKVKEFVTARDAVKAAETKVAAADNTFKEATSAHTLSAAEHVGTHRNMEKEIAKQPANSSITEIIDAVSKPSTAPDTLSRNAAGASAPRDSSLRAEVEMTPWRQAKLEQLANILQVTDLPASVTGDRRVQLEQQVREKFVAEFFESMHPAQADQVLSMVGGPELQKITLSAAVRLESGSSDLKKKWLGYYSPNKGEVAIACGMVHENGSLRVEKGRGLVMRPDVMRTFGHELGHGVERKLNLADAPEFKQSRQADRMHHDIMRETVDVLRDRKSERKGEISFNKEELRGLEKKYSQLREANPALDLPNTLQEYISSRTVPSVSNGNYMEQYIGQVKQAYNGEKGYYLDHFSRDLSQVDYNVTNVEKRKTYAGYPDAEAFARYRDIDPHGTNEKAKFLTPHLQEHFTQTVWPTLEEANSRIAGYDVQHNNSKLQNTKAILEQQAKVTEASAARNEVDARFKDAAKAHADANDAYQQLIRDKAVESTDPRIAEAKEKFFETKKQEDAVRQEWREKNAALETAKADLAEVRKNPPAVDPVAQPSSEPVGEVKPAAPAAEQNTAPEASKAESSNQPTQEKPAEPEKVPAAETSESKPASDSVETQDTSLSTSNESPSNSQSTSSNSQAQDGGTTNTKTSASADYTGKGMAITGLMTGGNRLREGVENGSTGEIIMGGIEMAAAGADVAASFKSVSSAAQGAGAASRTVSGIARNAGTIGAAVTVIDGAYQAYNVYDSNKSVGENTLAVGDKVVEVGIVATSNIYTLGMAGGAGAVIYDRAKENAMETAALHKKMMEMMSGARPVDWRELANDYAEIKIRDAKAGFEALRQSTPGQLIENSYKIVDASIETYKIYEAESKRFDAAFNEQSVATVRHRLGKEFVEVLKEDGAKVEGNQLILKDGTKLELTNDGKTLRNIDAIDFTKPENVALMDRALDKKIQATEKTYDENYTWRLWGETLDKRKDAESDLDILRSAKSQMGGFQEHAVKIQELRQKAEEAEKSAAALSATTLTQATPAPAVEQTPQQAAQTPQPNQPATVGQIADLEKYKNSLNEEQQKKTKKEAVESLSQSESLIDKLIAVLINMFMPNTGGTQGELLAQTIENAKNGNVQQERPQQLQPVRGAEAPEPQPVAQAATVTPPALSKEELAKAGKALGEIAFNAIDMNKDGNRDGNDLASAARDIGNLLSGMKVKTSGAEAQMPAFAMAGGNNKAQQTGVQVG